MTFRSVGVLFLLTACATSSPPPIKNVEVVGTRAQFRDYRGFGICDAEPRWLLDELRSVNRVLERFLKSTRPSDEGTASDQQLAWLEQAPDTLPPLIEAFSHNLEAIGTCAFGKQPSFLSLQRTGERNVRRARERLDAAAEMLAYFRANRVFQEWRQNLPSRQDEARELACADAKGSARGRTIYFAFEDTSERVEYLFCDGARVVKAPGEENEEIVPSGDYKGRWARYRPSNQSYLRLARGYPKEAIEEAPMLPRKPDSLRMELEEEALTGEGEGDGSADDAEE